MITLMFQVSWVRQSDLQILTSSTLVYISDHRFRATHSPDMTDWTLEISDSSFNDSGEFPVYKRVSRKEMIRFCETGAYECQTPGLNGKLGFSIFLQVIGEPFSQNVYFSESHETFFSSSASELETKIQEGPIALFRDGDDIKLNCFINFIPTNKASSYVFWFKDKELLNYQSPARLSVMTMNGTSEHLLSRLTIREADQSDSGNYSCQLNAPGIDSAHSNPAHVTLFVLDDDEYSSAMQGLSSKNGYRFNPARSWSSSTALQPQQNSFSFLLLLLLASKILMTRLR